MTCALSLSRLAANARALLSMAKGKPLYFVIKSNAYGHGLGAVLPTLLSEGAHRFAVASVKEALAFLSLLPQSLPVGRAAPRPVLLLLSPTEDISPLVAHPAFPLAEVRPSLSSLEQAHALLARLSAAKREGLAAPLPLTAEIKVETGLHRLGVSDTEELLSLFATPSLAIKGVYSHLGSADLPDSPRTALQCRAFSRFASLLPKGAPLTLHLSASAAFLQRGFLGLDGARVGLLLYGVSPFSPFGGARHPYSPLPAPFLPVKRLSARVLRIVEVPRGESVGYGDAPLLASTRVAVLDVGYAHGLPPTASSSGALVTLGGRPVPLCGSVCMEKSFANIGALPVKVGDEAIIYGEKGGSTEALAAACGISPHALLASGADAAPDGFF